MSGFAGSAFAQEIVQLTPQEFSQEEIDAMKHKAVHITTAEFIKNLKSIMLVFPVPIKAKRRISFYQVKIMLPCGSGRKDRKSTRLNSSHT